MIEMTNENNHFMNHNNMKLTELEYDHAVVEHEVKEESHNLFGGIHGGVYFTLADCAAGSAARTNGTKYVTLNNSFEFFRGTKSPVIRAYAKVRQRGKTICVIAVDVKDGEDKLLAGGTFTYFATGTFE